MLTDVVVSRYAEAFLQYARRTVGFEAVVQEVISLKQVFGENPQLREFLESPDFGDLEKNKMIDKLVEGNFPAEIGHFLKLLLEKSRIDKLPNIMEYVRMNYGGGGALSAVLTSAFPLDDDMMTIIKEAFEKKTSRRINLFVTFDSELLGGFKVKIGNKVFDASLRRQLDELRERSTEWRKE